MVIELRKTKDRQADSPTGGTAICRTTNHDANSDENVVNLTTPCFQWEKGKSIIMIYGKELIQAK